jgi:hypothetical protein
VTYRAAITWTLQRLFHLQEKQYPGKVSIMVIKEVGIEGCHKKKKKRFYEIPSTVFNISEKRKK